MSNPLSNSQSKQYLDAVSAHEALTAVKAQAAEYSGGMHWKTVSGRDYLYRSTDRRGNAKSLGPRSEAREEIYSQFTSRKADLSDRLASLREACLLHQRVNAAMRLGFVPNEVADVCIAVGHAHLMDKAIMVIGTNAMHVYASLGGVRFPGDILATTDVDLLWKHKAKLSLAVSRELSEAGLLGILKRADKSYELDAKNTFRARSKSNFMVDLIQQMPAPPWAQEPDRFFENDLVATDIANMNWLLGAPRITQPVIAIDGRVFDIAAPDPRAFAVFKVWLSQSEDRDPLKRGRDLAQAQAIIELISQRLPHFGNWGALKSFPQSALALAAGEIGLVSLGAKVTPR